MKICKYLAIDPGKRTGYARFDAQGTPIECRAIQGVDNFLDWLEEQETEVVVIERYRSRPGAINAWSDGPTQQLIGAIKRIARKSEWQIVEQDPSPALAIGLRYIGMATAYKGKHVPDEISALAHGEYYLVSKGIKKHRLEAKGAGN